MKNKKNLTIRFKSLEDLEAELLELPQTKNSHVQARDVIQFESINGFRKFMTLQKLELLTIIAFSRPKSIYQLAKMVGRGLAPVQKDCQLLSQTGFIVLIQEKDGRGSLRPKLKFTYNTITVELPEHPYELSFKAVA